MDSGNERDDPRQVGDVSCAQDRDEEVPRETGTDKALALEDRSNSGKQVAPRI